ncbi:MAG TPA: hypothetical protein VF857_03260 [Spirochaetota bacterium]
MRVRAIIIGLIVLFASWNTAHPQVSPDSPFRVYVNTDRLTFIEGEPVEIAAEIKNYSHKTAAFNTYDVNYTTFQPVAYEMNGKEAETLVKYRLMDRTVQDVVAYIEPRKSIVGHDEKVVKRLNLRDYYNLEAGKEYRVRIFFMPEAKSPFVVRSENSITIRIAPLDRDLPEPIELPKQYAGGIDPSEVVQLFLTAEKSRSWKNMIKYVDLEKYVNAYPDYGMQFNTANDAVRKKVLRDFVSFLSTPRHDYIVDFTVTKEAILEDRKSSYVDVKVVRHAAPKPFVYTYRFTLEDEGGTWLIAGVDATVSKERIVTK